MKPFLTFAVLVLSGSYGFGEDLPRSPPEAQGVSSAGVLSFIEAVDKDVHSLNSFMLVRHGSVVAEGWWAPYEPEARHSLYSLSKSFTSTAIGIAVAEGKLSLDDEVLKFFPEDAPTEPGNNLKAMRVSDLLRMNTGHQSEPPRPLDQSWTKAFLAHPVPFKPGTHFQYNTSATYMCSAILQKVTGQTLLEYLKPRLFDPLGIEKPTWEMSPQGVATGGYGLSVRTGDIARFGQLYLQKGKWHDKQLLSETWIDAATSRQTSNGSNPSSDWDQGYGYQFWRCRHGAYRGDGAFGQYCIVLPEQDAVIAITSGLRDMQQVLNLVWDKLLPALENKALPANQAVHSQLVTRLKGLSLKPQAGNSPALKTALNRKFVIPANDTKLETITLENKESETGTTLVASINGAEQRIPCGTGTWSKGKAAWGPLASQRVAGSGAWTDESTYTAQLCFYETPFVVTVTLKFSGDEVQVTSESNVAFGATKSPRLVGKVQ